MFWLDEHDGKTRLTSARLAPGAASFSPPSVAIDEPLSPRPPVTAQLPNGTWAVAWIASTGGPSTLRVSPIGPDATLTSPSEITKSARIDGLRAISTDRGIDYFWREDDHTVRIARVSCAP